MSEALGRWEPLVPDEVVALLSGAAFPWWIAGGWAIDLHVGRQTRDHADADVLVLRDDLPAVQEALTGWDLHAADPPGTLRPWRTGELLPAYVHDVWCRPGPGEPWALQLMVDDLVDEVVDEVVDDAVGRTWRYRRDGRVRRPVGSLDGRACDGDPRVLAPEVQLLAKSKGRRAKDEADLSVAAPTLSAPQRAWLLDALELVSPGHPWLERL